MQIASLIALKGEIAQDFPHRHLWGNILLH